MDINTQRRMLEIAGMSNMVLTEAAAPQFHVYRKLKGDRMGGPEYDFLKSFDSKEKADAFVAKQKPLAKGGFFSYVVRTRKAKVEESETIKEDAAQSLIQRYGSLGQAVIDVLESYKGMAIDPSMAGELDTEDMAPKSMEGYVEDMINDQLSEIYASAEYKQLCTEMMGQHSQISAQPDQGVLDV